MNKKMMLLGLLIYLSSFPMTNEKSLLVIPTIYKSAMASVNKFHNRPWWNNCANEYKDVFIGNDTIEVNDFVSENKDDNLIILSRFGHKIVELQLEMLKSSKTAQNMIADCSQDENSNKFVVREMFKGLDSRKGELMVNALKNNKDKEVASHYVSSLEPQDLSWLANKSDYWDMEHILSSLVAKITQLIAPEKNFKHYTGLNNDLGLQILDDLHIDKKDIQKKLFDLLHVETEAHGVKSWSVHKDELLLVESADYNQKRVIVYDVSTGQRRDDFKPLLDKHERIKGICHDNNGDCFVLTDKRITVYDAKTHEQRFTFAPDDYTSFIPNDTGFEKLFIDVNNDKLVLCFTDSLRYKSKVMAYDIQTGQQEDITPYLNEKDQLYVLGKETDDQMVMIIRNHTKKKPNRLRAVKHDIKSGQQSSSYIDIDSENDYVVGCSEEDLITARDREVTIHSLETISKKSFLARDPNSYAYNEHVCSVRYNEDKNRIITELRLHYGSDAKIFIYPNVFIEELNWKQQLLLSKAYSQWEKRHRYFVDDHDLSTFYSLPDGLRNFEKLFLTTPRLRYEKSLYMQKFCDSVERLHKYEAEQKKLAEEKAHKSIIS